MSLYLYNNLSGSARGHLSRTFPQLSIQQKATKNTDVIDTEPLSRSVASEFKWPIDPLVHKTDMGNAQKLVNVHGSGLRYCWPWKKWFVWDGVRWKPDDTGEIYRCAKETVRLMFIDAAGASGQASNIDQKTAKHAMRSESKQALRAMVELAQSEPGIPILPHELDTDPWKLTVADGTLDLKTGKLNSHEKEDFITKLAPVNYNPNAVAPIWESFLNRIMDDNQQLIDFLQRAGGYSLTGDTSERILFILHGRGANGKTTFLETIRALLGDYSLRTPTETLLAKFRGGGGIPNDVARLRGARLVTATESDEGRRLAEATIKDLTGGDTISARFLHAEFFEFKPKCKLWLGTNHKPEIRGTDKAIWDRIRLIPFEVVIPEDEQDKHLIDKLKKELPGILAWAVKGCLKWQKDGLLNIPDAVKEATASYRTEMDILGGFLIDCCRIEQRLEVTVKALYDAYTTWCETNGDKPIGKRTFGRRLNERGFDSHRGTGGTWIWMGIEIKTENSDI